MEDISFMLNTYMKTVFQKIALLCMSFVFISSMLLSSLGIIVPQGHAYAGSLPPAPIDDIIQNYITLYIMSASAGDNHCTLKNNMSPTDVATNNWGIDNGNQWFHGYSFPGGQDNRLWGCETFITKIAPLWLKYTGYQNNSVGFLKEIGYSCDANNNCSGGSSKALGLLIKLLQKDSPEGHSVMDYINVSGTSISPSNGLKYAIWLDTFTGADGNDIAGCAATYLSAYGDPSLHTNNQIMAMAGTNGQGTNGSSPTEKYVINAVHEDGSIVLDIYTADEVGHTVAVLDGVGASKSAGGIGSGNTSCGEVAAVLFQSKAPQDPGFKGNPNFSDKNDSWANAYVEILKNDPTAKNKIHTNSSDNGAPSPYDKCFITIPLVGWIMCSLLSLADNTLQWFSAQVESLLFIGKDGLSDSGSNAQLHQSWNAVKDITSVGILLVGLFMIMTQIFSLDFLSAYTVKKLLPRLIIAAILIQLSWVIFKNLIFLVDAIGTGIQQLILTPFSLNGNFNNLNINTILASGNGTQDMSGLGTAGLFAAVSVGVAAAAAGGMVGLAIVALGVLISVLTAMFTLIIRNVLIFIFLVLSPIALLAWILPGTQGLWKNWWSNFSKLLFMFPIIMLLLAAGAIGAKIISSDTGIPPVLATMGAIVAYFGPLFLIPATFKYAGSAMAAASGGVSKMSGMVKEKNPLSKSLGKAAQVRQGLKDNNARINAISGRGLKKYRGKFATGAYGADRLPGMSKIREDNNQARQMYQYAEQSEAMKLQMQALDMKTHGMDAGAKSQFFLDQAKNSSLGETAQRAAATRLVEMQDTARLRELKETLTDPNASQAQQNLFNTIKGENYSGINSIAPDVLGKGFEELSAESMTTMKPETWSVMQDQMSTLDSQSRDMSLTAADRAAAASKLSSVRNQLDILQSTPAYIGKLSSESKNALMEIYTTPPGSPIPVSGKNKYGK
jgi:hypothetical protein